MMLRTVALLVIALFTLACSESQDVQLLRSLDIADMEVPSGVQVDEKVTSERAGSPFNKRRLAELRQTYEPVDGVELTELLDELYITTLEHGWELEEGSTPDFFSQTRQIQDETVIVSLFIPTYSSQERVILRMRVL